MADPARRHDDEAVDILRRLEPALTRLDQRVQSVEHGLREVQDEQRRQGEAMAELRGRVGQLPTLIQIITAVLAVNAGIVAIGFGLARALTG